MLVLTGVTTASLALLLASGCKKKFEIRDVDPTRPGTVRSLGPESQDVITLSDQMVRDLLAQRFIQNRTEPPTIVMLPMTNNTRHNFNPETFSSLFKSQLNQRSQGKILFVSRDINPDILAEREMKRGGQVDYDPNLRAVAPAGADYFLKGRADGLAAVSTRGQADFIVYTFKLTDAETGIDMWEKDYQTKREGRDDVIYR